MTRDASALEPWAERLRGRTGRRFWRALDELADQPAFEAALRAEFPSAFDGVAGVERRTLLRALGASLALGLAACSGRGDPEALPYVVSPGDETDLRHETYATAVVMAGYAQPVLGRTYAGRPIKLEGSPGHPASRGAADAFTQAALLGLYDPDRSQGPLRLGRPAAWPALEAALVANAARLDSTGGEGLRLLTGAQTSPTFARQLEALMARWPKARWHMFEAADIDPSLTAARLAFGRPLRPLLDLEQAEVVVSLDHDLLGPGPEQVRHARDWSLRRRAFQQGRGDARLFVAEPTTSATGAMGERLIAGPFEIAGLTLALASAVGMPVVAPVLAGRAAAWAARAGRALRRAGGAGLVTVGPQHAREVQALALQINQRLGALGRTMRLTEPPRLEPPDGERSLEALGQAMHAGAVDTLLILDANPAYAAPPDLRFAEAMQKVRWRLHAGLHRDETGRLCHWHAPLQHDLETWSDARAVDGRVSLIQPLVRPFYEVRSRHTLLQNLMGDLSTDDRAPVAVTWRAAWGDDFEARWRDALVQGFITDPSEENAAPATVAAPIALSASPASQDLTAIIRTDPCIWDGRFASNPWLQELPKPLSKLTWENAVAVSPALAREHGLANGDGVRIEAQGRSVEGPAWITPGQEPRTVTLYLGYGRRTPGLLADQLGYDANPLRSTANPTMVDGVRLTRTGERRELATTQSHTALEGFDFVRTVAAEHASAIRAKPRPRAPAYFGAPQPQKPPQWGMSIDLDLCIGCNACVTACDAENNIAMVGKDQVAKGREMHWLRIDAYHEGPPDDPSTYFQPVPCMHCEAAPCEMGCPVNATLHSPDGLNLQVYNRCIGTRTCSSFCPYKVRHFNWFDYSAGASAEHQAVRNPEVTVRTRGVMEKCTYCVQRIEAERIEAKKVGRPMGEVKTACQQTCPTEAIVFGDIADPNSEVSRRKALARDYTLLEEVNTKPRTTYLARLDPPADDNV